MLLLITLSVTQTILLIAVLALFYFSVSRVRRYRILIKWRKQLARNDYAKFYIANAWHIGIIRKFKDNGKTVEMLEIGPGKTNYYQVPLKILTPAT